jgi:nucleotide-binding universal stress UspA family protein
VDAVIRWNYPAAAAGYGWAPAGTDEDLHFRENAEKPLADAISSASARAAPCGGARTVEGNPAQVLLDASDDADLLVVGNRGHGGFTEALLGSVSQHCVHHAHCPVAVIRGQEPAAPKALWVGARFGTILTAHCAEF